MVSVTTTVSSGSLAASSTGVTVSTADALPAGMVSVMGSAA